MNKQPKIFVIVVTYKGQQWYDRCFTSLRESDMPVETIVIDNGNDGTVEYLQEHFPEITILPNTENLGFGKANNMGMRYALDHGCDYVFLLNQDAWIFPDTMEQLVAAAEANPEYGIVAPVQCNKELTKALDGVIQFLINPDNVNRELFSDLMMGTVKDIYPVAEINAAAWLLPRKTLEMVGGFDPIFLHYGEDWNYLSRVLYHGMKVGLMPKVRVVHDCVDRVEQKQGYGMTFDKWLLQRATDITYPDENVDKMIAHYRRMATVKLLTFHKATYEENKGAYQYLMAHRQEIEFSRKENKERKANWL